MKLSLLLFTLLLLSCQRKVVVVFDGGRTVLEEAPFSISKIRDVSWKVGPLRRQTLSKGVDIEVKFPVFEKEDLIKIMRKYHVDSWLIRVKRRSSVSSEKIGSIYIPLVVPGTFNSKASGNKIQDLRVNQMKKGHIKIFYSAAALSTRFQKLACPAFGHNKIVSEFETEKISGLSRSLYLSYVESRRYHGRVEKFGYRDQSLNGGSIIKGDYYFDIALYNSKKRETKSSFLTFGELVKIKGESVVRLKGCTGARVPENKTDEKKIQDFHFGR